MTERLVVDAGPIITFARAGQLGLLQKVLPAVIIGPTVFEEVALARPDLPGAIELREGDWGELQPPVDPAMLRRVPLLEPGERETLALALQLNLPVLVDERRAITAARQLGLEVVTSLRVLATAKDLGFIPAVKPVLDDMRASTFRLKDRIYQIFLAELGE